MLRGLDWGVHIASTSVNRRFICYLIMSQRIFKDSCDFPSVSPFSLYPACSTCGTRAFLILSKHVCCPRAWRTLSCQFLLFGIPCLLTILLLLHSILSSNPNTWADLTPVETVTPGVSFPIHPYPASLLPIFSTWHFFIAIHLDLFVFRGNTCMWHSN